MSFYDPLRSSGENASLNINTCRTTQLHVGIQFIKMKNSKQEDHVPHRSSEKTVQIKKRHMILL